MIEPPEPPPGWLDGPASLLVMAALMLAGCLLGATFAVLDNAARQPPPPPTALAPQERNMP